MKFSPLKQGGIIPFPRCGHKTVIYKDNLYLFGGNTQGNYSNLNYLFKYNLFSQEWNILSKLPGQVPEKRTAHAMLIYKDTLYCFSGALGDDDGNFEITTFNFETLKWEKLSTLIEQLPESRYGHTAVLLDHKAYIFGGCSNLDHNQLNEVIEFDLEDIFGTWNITKNNRVKCFSFHTSDLDPKKRVVYHFGGLRYIGDHPLHSNELATYKIDSRKWEIEQYQSNICPMERRSHGSCLGDDGSLFIFGGFNPKKYFLNDLWKFDFATKSWSLIKYQGEISNRRYFSISKYENGFIIFGGVNNERYENRRSKLDLLNDLYRFEWISRIADMKSNLRIILKKGYFSDTVLKFSS